MHYHWRQTAAKKKERGHVEQRTLSKKSSETLTMVD